MGTDGEPIVRAPAMTLAAAEKEKGDGKRKADSQKKKKKKKVGSRTMAKGLTCAEEKAAGGAHVPARRGV